MCWVDFFLQVIESKQYNIASSLNSIVVSFLYGNLLECFLPCSVYCILPHDASLRLLRVAVSFLQPANALLHGHEETQHYQVKLFKYHVSDFFKIRTFIYVHFMDVLKRMHLAGERRGLSAPSANKAVSFITKIKKLRLRCNSKAPAFRKENAKY